jgi:hypothetical protein
MAMKPGDKRRNNKGNPKLVKGVSLNPTGRPKGSVNKYTALSRELMSTKGPEIVEKVIEMALEGDRICLKMCMDRILPTTKAVELRSGDDNKGNVVINIGGLEAKVIEADAKEPLEYDEGVIIDDAKIESKVVEISNNG